MSKLLISYHCRTQIQAPLPPTLSPQGRGNNAFCLWAFLCVFAWFPLISNAEPPSGIQPLHQLPKSQIHSLIHGDFIHPLLTAQEQETFLRELEKQPPDWDQLHDPPGEEHGALLFDLNRHRDDLREGHPLLNQRIAFLWSGILREYHEEHRGYKVVMGPEFTQTAWGIVRFKPMSLPDEMVAIPSPTLLPLLKKELARGEQLEVGILFTGKLVPNESIIYGFSHDGLEQGMILPVAQVDGVHYILNAKTD